MTFCIFTDREKNSAVALCSENIVGSAESHLHFYSVQIASTHVRANSEKLNGTVSMGDGGNEGSRFLAVYATMIAFMARSSE